MTREADKPWRVIAALGMTQVIGYGTAFYSFSPLMQPMQGALGASKGSVVGAFSLALLVAAACAVRVGRTIDRHGGRWIMAGGSLVAGLLLVALSRIDSVAGLYLVYVGLGVAMAAILYEPAFAVLTQAFGARARQAITALTLIAGFSSTVFWPLTQFLIGALGWRGAVLVLAGLNLLVCVPLHLLALPRRPAPEVRAANTRLDHRAADLRQALRTPAFYWLAGTLVTNGLIFSTMSVHMIPVLESKGLSALGAAGIAALVGPMQVAGRILEVTVGRRFDIARVGLLALGAMPVALLCLFAAGTGTWSLALFAALYGASNGVFTIVRGALPAELFGREHYGAINGALSAPYLVSHALGPSLAALLWTALGGSYDRVILALTLVAAAGIGLYVAATRHHASVRQTSP